MNESQRNHDERRSLRYSKALRHEVWWERRFAPHSRYWNSPEGLQKPHGSRMQRAEDWRLPGLLDWGENKI